MKIKLLDAFAGIGGFHLGVQQACGELDMDFKCVGAIEYDKYACQTYQENFLDIPMFGDITKVNIRALPAHNLLTGGFPCQSFSLAGNKLGSKDSRGILINYLIEILKYHQPKYFIFENVANIKNTNGGQDYTNIISALEQVGYSVFTDVVDLDTHTNIPQCRKRMFFVGIHGKTTTFQFPLPIVLTSKISSILQRNIKQESRYYYKTDSQYYDMLKDNVIDDAIYQLRRIYVRRNQNGLCPTLTANMGTGGHNVPLIKDRFGIRKLTPQECLLLQGFPSTFKYSVANGQIYKQAGNSVCPVLVNRILKCLY